MKPNLLGAVTLAALLGPATPGWALDWLKPCKDWTGRVPGAVTEPARPVLYVAMGKCEAVLAVDTRTHEVVAALRAGDGAHGIAVPAPRAVYVTNRKDDTLSLLDFAAGRTLRHVPTGRYPLDVVPVDGGRLVVSTWKGDTVEIYDREGRRLDTIPGGDPTHFAVSPDGKTAFLAHWSERRVVAHDATSWKTLFEVPTGEKPVHLTVTPDSRWLVVTNFGSADVTVVDLAARRPVATVAVGAKPLGLVASGDGKRVFVATMDDQAIAVIDVAAQRVSRRLKAEGEPQHLALAQDGRTVYVTMPHEGRVDVFDAADLTWRARIDTGPSPQQIAPRYATRPFVGAEGAGVRSASAR